MVKKRLASIGMILLLTVSLFIVFSQPASANILSTVHTQSVDFSSSLPNNFQLVKGNGQINNGEYQLLVTQSQSEAVLKETIPYYNPKTLSWVVSTKMTYETIDNINPSNSQNTAYMSWGVEVDDSNGKQICAVFVDDLWYKDQTGNTYYHGEVEYHYDSNGTINLKTFYSSTELQNFVLVKYITISISMRTYSYPQKAVNISFDVTYETGRGFPVTKTASAIVQDSNANVFDIADYKVNYKADATTTIEDSVAISYANSQIVTETGLTAPQNLNAVATTKPSVKLSWSPVSDATYYKVFRDGELIATIDGVNNTNYTDTTVTYGKTYTYYVIAGIDPDANTRYYPVESDKSQEITVTISQQYVPQNLKAQAKVVNNQPEIILTWDGDSSVSEYKVYRGTSADSLSYIKTVSTTTYTDINVEWGKTYYYAVSSYNPDTGNESAKSEVVSVSLSLSPPQNVHISSSTNPLEVTLTWDSVSGASQYLIYKGTTSGGENYYANTTSTIFHDRNVEGGNTYYYYIIAESGSGDKSSPSQEVSIYLQSSGGGGGNNTNTTTTPPKNLEAQVLKDVSGKYLVELSWTGVSGVDYYKIYRGTEIGKETYIGQTTKTYYNDYNVENGKTYYYYVTAVFNGKESKSSNEIVIKVTENSHSNNTGNTNINPKTGASSFINEPMIYISGIVIAIATGIFIVWRYILPRFRKKKISGAYGTSNTMSKNQIEKQKQ